MRRCDRCGAHVKIDTKAARVHCVRCVAIAEGKVDLYGESDFTPRELLLAIGAHVERRLTFDQRRELFTIVARPRPGQTPELVEADTIVGVVRKAREAGIL